MNRMAFAVGLLSMCSVAHCQECFTKLVNGQAPSLEGYIARGSPDGIDDATQCVPDWNRNGVVEVADVALFVVTWWHAVIVHNGNVDEYADINCTGSTNPADVANFVNRWFLALTNPAASGC